MYGGCSYTGKPFWAIFFTSICFAYKCPESNELNFLVSRNVVYDDNIESEIIILLLNYATKRFSECKFFDIPSLHIVLQ